MNLFSPTESFQIAGILLAIVAFSIVGDQKKWFGNISGVLVAIIISAIFASIGIIPSGSDPSITVPVYDFAFTWLIPFSIPLLLFNIQLNRIFKESGRLMVLFLIGAIGVVIGSILSGWLFDLGDHTYKLAGVFTATYTGGSVNFMAVASTFDFLEDPLFAASIVVDNVFTIFYIMILFMLPKIKTLQKYFPKPDLSDVEIQQNEHDTAPGTLEQIGISLAVSGILVGIGIWISPILEQSLQTELKLDVLLITVFILLFANVASKWLIRYEKMAFQLGIYMLYFFLAVIGATCDISNLFTSSPKVILFACVILFVHLIVTLLAARLLKFSLEDIAIASGANAGGVSISAPMAATFKMKKAVTPAILIGIMGYIVGTFLGIGVGLFLK